MNEHQSATPEDIAGENYKAANTFMAELEGDSHVSVDHRDTLQNLGYSDNAPDDLARGLSYDSSEAKVKDSMGDEVAKVKTESDNYYPAESLAQVTQAEVMARKGYVDLPESGPLVKYEARTSADKRDERVGAKVTRRWTDESGKEHRYEHKFKSPEAATNVAKVAMNAIERGETPVDITPDVLEKVA